MDASIDPYVYAVDAGGSRTSASVTRAGEVLAEWTTESFAIASVGPDNASATLAGVIGKIRAAMSVEADAIGCIGTSSMPVGGEAPPPEQLIAVVADLAPPGRVVVVNDVIPLLWSPELAGVGVVISSGTGSSVVGRGASGTTVKVGGHEHIVSDQGSAYSIARAGLRAAAADSDRTKPARCLRERAESFFGRSMPALGRWLAELPRARPVVAGFAPLVIAAAEDGDLVAREIVVREADYLALSAQVACQRLQLDNEPRIALAGGVMQGSALFRNLVQEALTQRSLTDAELVNVFLLDGIACARHFATMSPGGGDSQAGGLGAGPDGLALTVGARRV